MTWLATSVWSYVTVEFVSTTQRRYDVPLVIDVPGVGDALASVPIYGECCVPRITLPFEAGPDTDASTSCSSSSTFPSTSPSSSSAAAAAACDIARHVIGCHVLKTCGLKMH